jgi:hypothetical protein
LDDFTPRAGRFPFPALNLLARAGLEATDGFRRMSGEGILKELGILCGDALQVIAQVTLLQ